MFGPPPDSLANRREPGKRENVHDPPIGCLLLEPYLCGTGSPLFHLWQSPSLVAIPLVLGASMSI